PLTGVLDGPPGDVALALEDLGDALLDLRVGHRDPVVVRLVGVAQTRQHVCDRIGHGHVLVSLSGRGSRARANRAGAFGEAVSPGSLVVTRTLWKRRGAHRGGPFPGCTPGTGRTCGRPPWGGRSAGSECTRAPGTSASAPP